MKECLLVGVGGACGSMLRYLLGQVPIYSLFPIVTFLINVAAAIIMGFITAWLDMRVGSNGAWSLLLRTGFCGGFSTLSALSLEVVNLGQTHHLVLGITYAVFSMLLCLAGILVGEFLASHIL
jgi:CrcB protein